MRFSYRLSLADLWLNYRFIKDELHLVGLSYYQLFYNFTHRGSLDTIGIAGFSHDFGALDGKHASVTQIFDAFSSSSHASSLSIGLNLLAQVFPFLVQIPTPRGKLTMQLNSAMEEISNVLLTRTRKELDMGAPSEQEEKSVIGLLSMFQFRKHNSGH